LILREEGLRFGTDVFDSEVDGHIHWKIKYIRRGTHLFHTRVDAGHTFASSGHGRGKEKGRPRGTAFG
jgi:hypothetical protein